MDILCTLVPSAVVRRRLIFVSAALPKEYPLYWETVVKFATGDNPDVLEESFKRKLQIALQNLRTIYPAAFISDRELAEELVHMQKRDGSGELGVVLISDKSSCFQCGNSLRLRSDRPSQVTIYSESVGTTVGMHYHKLCKNPKCKVVQHYGYVTSGLKSGAQYDDNWADLPYFVSSQETVFETEFLKKMDSELLIGQLSYNQKADIYNHYQCYDSFKKRNTKLDSKKKSKTFQSDEVLLTSETCKSNRTPLDRRRLENAHLRFAVLRIQRSFPEVFSDTTIKPDIHYTLKEINPKLCLAFKQRYSAHRCLYPGCGYVLVIDGNMKNHRDICFAKNSGHIEFMNLPGQIKTGCINTPAYKSRYCADHTSLSGASNEQPLKVITAKKTTRAGIYYQVLCVGPNDKVTWEPESNVTKEMVEDYKRHEDDNEDDNKEADDQSKDHSAKRRRTDTEDETVMTQGKLMDNDMKEDKLKCNTEKDKNMRLNHRTAGVLATMWPCGIITSLNELYCSESIGLVYGYLYDMYNTFPDVCSTIKFICYDDGCHLRKYARNSQRNEVSSAAAALAKIEIVIDKLHMRGHVDKWCAENCDPNNFEELNDVDTEVCEQTFSWMSAFGKMTKRMNQHVYTFFLTYICHLHNAKELIKLKSSSYM